MKSLLFFRACNHGGVGGFIYKLLIKVGRAEWDARKGVRAKAGTSRWFEALWVCTEVVLEKWILRTPVRSAKAWRFISLFSLTFHVGALLVFLLLVKGKLRSFCMPAVHCNSSYSLGTLVTFSQRLPWEMYSFFRIKIVSIGLWICGPYLQKNFFWIPFGCLYQVKGMQTVSGARIARYSVW